MKILVAVKRVVDAKIKVRPLPDHSGVDVKLAKMAMNPFDEIAIEKAVTLREAGVADEVVAVTVGPLKAVDTLRVAMATRRVSTALRGPTVTATTSSATPASRSVTAFSIAISSKGFIAILASLTSTPE